MLGRTRQPPCPVISEFRPAPGPLTAWSSPPEPCLHQRRPLGRVGMHKLWEGAQEAGGLEQGWGQGDWEGVHRAGPGPAVLGKAL